MQIVYKPHPGRSWSLGSHWQHMDFQIISLLLRKKPACPGQEQWPHHRLAVTAMYSPASHGSVLEPRENSGLWAWDAEWFMCHWHCNSARLGWPEGYTLLRLNIKDQGHGSSFYGGNFVLRENILNSPTWYTGKDRDFGLQPALNSQVAVWLCTLLIPSEL